MSLKRKSQGSVFFLLLLLNLEIPQLVTGRLESPSSHPRHTGHVLPRVMLGLVRSPLPAGLAPPQGCAGGSGAQPHPLTLVLRAGLKPPVPGGAQDRRGGPV